MFRCQFGIGLHRRRHAQELGYSLKYRGLTCREILQRHFRVFHRLIRPKRTGVSGHHLISNDNPLEDRDLVESMEAESAGEFRSCSSSFGGSEIRSLNWHLRISSPECVQASLYIELGIQMVRIYPSYVGSFGVHSCTPRRGSTQPQNIRILCALEAVRAQSW